MNLRAPAAVVEGLTRGLGGRSRVRRPGHRRRLVKGLRPPPGGLPRRPALHRRGMPGGAAWAAVAAATALSAGLGAYHMAGRSLWLDESYTWLISAQSTAGVRALAGGQGGHLLAYYLLVHWLISLFGASVWILRLPSLVAGAATVPLVYLLTCRLGANRLAGVLAAGLFAVSAPLVYYQQDARDYAVVVLLAVATTLALVVAVQSARASVLVAWAVLSALACYTHAEATLLVAAQLLALPFTPRLRILWRPLAVLVALAALASIPPLAFAAGHAGTQSAFLQLPTGADVREVAAFLASGAGTPAPVTGADYALLGVTAALWATALGFLVADVITWGRSNRTFSYALALSWLISPSLLALIVSEVSRPVFLDRYLIVSLPAAAVTAAMVLVRVRPRALGFFGLIYLLVFRFGVLVPTYDKSYDNFAAATARILGGARRGDCIAFYQTSERIAYDYYSVRHRPKKPLPVQVLPNAPSGDDPATVYHYATLPAWFLRDQQKASVMPLVAYYCPRLWLLESHVGSPSGPPSQRARYQGLVDLEKKLSADFAPPTTYGFTDVSVLLYRSTHHQPPPP